jgi:hypothetical protein
VSDFVIEGLDSLLGPQYPLAADTSRALEGAVYPLEREALVRIALENEAPRTLVSLLHALPRRPYRSLDEVTRALSEAPSS